MENLTGFVYFVIVLSVGIGMYFTGRSMGIEWAVFQFTQHMIVKEVPEEEKAKEA